MTFVMIKILSFSTVEEIILWYIYVGITDHFMYTKVLLLLI